MTNAPKLPLWVIALGTGSAVMGITLITPALPAIVSALNVLPEKVQQLLTFYLAMLALGQLAIGPLSDVFGRRIFFITGAFLIGASGLVTSFISQIDVLIFLRAIQGLGAAACISMGRTMVNDFFSRADAQKAMASVQTIQAIVPMISLSCGGAIVFYAGWEGIMILISLAGIVLFICSLILLPETNVSKRPELNLSAILMGYKSVLKNRLFRAYLSVSSLQIAAFFALNAFIPYAYQKVGSTSLTFGLWFALTPLAYITGNLVNRLYMIKKGLETGILVGCSLSILSMILMLALNLISWQHPLSLAI
ncbi:MAG: MFS transporter, partial [Candidatus Puniceispirillaceae bacterium]